MLNKLKKWQIQRAKEIEQKSKWQKIVFFTIVYIIALIITIIVSFLFNLLWCNYTILNNIKYSTKGGIITSIEIGIVWFIYYFFFSKNPKNKNLNY